MNRGMWLWCGVFSFLMCHEGYAASVDILDLDGKSCKEYNEKKSAAAFIPECIEKDNSEQETATTNDTMDDSVVSEEEGCFFNALSFLEPRFIYRNPFLEPLTQKETSEKERKRIILKAASLLETHTEFDESDLFFVAEIYYFAASAVFGSSQRRDYLTKAAHLVGSSEGARFPQKESYFAQKVHYCGQCELQNHDDMENEEAWGLLKKKPKKWSYDKRTRPFSEIAALSYQVKGTRTIDCKLARRKLTSEELGREYRNWSRHSVGAEAPVEFSKRKRAKKSY